MAKSSDEFAVNERVQHSVYGPGTITERDSFRTTIEFDQHGRRKFVTELLRIEHTDTAAPPKTGPGSRSRKTPAKPKKK